MCIHICVESLAETEGGVKNQEKNTKPLLRFVDLSLFDFYVDLSLCEDACRYQERATDLLELLQVAVSHLSW